MVSFFFFWFFPQPPKKKIEDIGPAREIAMNVPKLGGGFGSSTLMDGIWTFQWKGFWTWYTVLRAAVFSCCLQTGWKKTSEALAFFCGRSEVPMWLKGPTRDISGAPRGASLPMPLEKEGGSSWIVGGFWEKMSWGLYSKTLEVWKFCDRNLLSDNKRFDCSEAPDFDVRCWGSSDFKQHHRLPTYIFEPFSYNSAVDRVMKMVVIAVPSVSSPACCTLHVFFRKSLEGTMPFQSKTR